MTVPAAELIVLGHYDQPLGYATRRAAGAPSWLLMWTQAGEGLVEQGGAALRAGPGSLVVLASGEPHHYRVAPGARRWRFWWVHFQPRPSWTGWLAPHALAPGCHLVADVPEAVHDRIDAAFRRALHDSRWLPPASYAPAPATASQEGPRSPYDPQDPAPTLTDAPTATGETALREAMGGGTRPAEVQEAVEWVSAAPAPEDAPEGSGGTAAAVRAGEMAAGEVAVVAGVGAARELVMGAVEEVLVVATASVRAGEEGGDGRVRRALALIAAEPGAPHTVGSLARAVALSPSRFAHLFAEETGRTPMRAVREARLRHAAMLLEATDLDVGRVAAASGFVSPFHFSRAFRREHGVPPRAYRARVRG
ncbi:AraC family transcriptional regulator [Nonomuraea sp. NPDC049725]|uniref:AraC family transcriptional regulator n=1 Tax=Nonomuraea sp. NPDC049725 TaxID=3154508 RepID=UPI0034282366